MNNCQVNENRVAIVTGSGRGIGRAIALRLARDGVDVVINYFRNKKPAEETALTIKGMGRKVLVVKANIGELDQLEELFLKTEQTFGGLDILINNAASGYNRPIMEQKAKGWEWTLNINARAALFSSKLAQPLMIKRGGGHIVNITSMGSQFALPDYVVVGASKAALESITRYMAVELAPFNIIANAVSPGMANTQALQHFRQLQADLDTQMTNVQQSTPAGRLVTPEDIADVVAFLCSPAAFMIRGQIIVVDGGFTLRLGTDIKTD
ncbi:MAG: enoyl-[acyl-carrier-protein] reductase FabL [Anaerolineales bacterium]|nr:enoyl-[acyl-carrier-protein] reductase FabL [Anaerolineales bacterium]